MKRFWIMLLVVAVALVMALPVGAVKPGCSTYPEGHPLACPGEPDDPPVDEPLAGLTCAEVADGYGFSTGTWTGPKTFTVELGVRQDACVDVTSDAGLWTVEVDMGTALEVTVALQDSVAPGDFCWGGCAGDGTFTKDGTKTFEETAASVINACGINFDDEDDQLAFTAWASYRGNPHIADADKATITVTLP